MKTLTFRKLATIMFALGIVVSETKAANYYVATNGSDVSGDGSVGNPWATIDHADAQSLLVAGDTVFVAAGTYPQASAAGVVLQNGAGTSGTPITYLANGKVIIDQSAYPGANYGIQVKASGITLSGFEISHAAHAIYINGAGDCVVSNCVMHDSQPLVDSTGVFFNAAWHSTVEKSVMYNLNSGVDAPWGPLGAAVRTEVSTNILVLNNTFVNTWLGVFVMNQAPPWAPLTTLNNIAAGCKGWAFVNPWSTDPSWCTNGYNLIFDNAISYGNYPPGNNPGADVPQPTDVGPVDPQFVFAATADFHLLSNSPAIDKGTNVGLPFQGAAPDIGAFEGGYPASTNGTITGRVTANAAGNPSVPNALVRTLDGSASTTSDANGNYTLIVPAGTVTLVASGRGLATETNSTTLPNGGNTVLNISLAQTYTPVTYYVDSTSGNDANPGTKAQPWKTIDNGDRLNVLNPGDTVIVMAGTYPQASTNGVHLVNDYGYVFSQINYQAQGSVVIDQSSYTGASYGFNITVAGIKVNGFEITGAQHGVYLSPSSSACTVNGCVIHDANGVGQDADGIFADNSPNDTITHNVIYNINDASDGPWSPVGSGVRVSDANNLKIFNNTIDNAFIGVFYYGARLDQFGQDHGPWGTISAMNNIVVNCPGWGFTSPGSQDASLVSCGYNVVSNLVDYENFPGTNAAPLPTDVKNRNPLFVNEAAHNYQLQSGSPAIDMGNYVGLSYSGVGPDIGALESGYSNAPQTYYVNASTGNDSNPGTSVQPWRSIGNGDATGVLKPGDTVVVNAGTYAQSSAAGVQLTNCSGTSIVPITYQAQGSVLIDQSSFGTGSYGVQVKGSSIVLKGFEIKGATVGALLAPGSSSCVVDSCVIHDASAAGVDASGIFVQQSANATLQRNVIYNILDPSDGPWSPVGSGIRDSDSANLRVLNNTIDHCYLGLFFYGPALGGGPYGSITTYNNIVANCAGWGFVNPWNTTPQIFTHGYNLTFNDNPSYGNYPGGNQGPLLHDIDGQNPMFVDASAHNYALQAGSPAIQSGINVGLPFSGRAPSMGAIQPVLLNATLQGNTVTLSWQAPWTLQSAVDLMGSWTNVVGATSPYAVTNNGPKVFFRLKQ